MIIYIACVGFTIIVTQSSLFESLRNYISSKSSFLGELINCPLCFGFWAGVIMSMYAFFFYGYSEDPLLLGFSSSILSFLCFHVLNLISTISNAIDFNFSGDDDEQ